MNPLRRELCERIRSLFETDPPDPRSSSYFGLEYMRESEGLWNKPWADIELDIFHKKMFCLSYLDAKHFPFFFGALLYQSLEQNDFEPDALLIFLGVWIDADECSDVLEEAGLDSNSLPSGQELLLRARKLREFLSDDMVDAFEAYFDYRNSLEGVSNSDNAANFVKSLKFCY